MSGNGRQWAVAGFLLFELYAERTPWIDLRDPACWLPPAITAAALLALRILGLRRDDTGR